jgi:thiol-disulfide isomerase/thioredoxin
MRQTLYLLLMCLCTLYVFAQKKTNKQFILKGKIINSKGQILYLIYDINGKEIEDSCKLKQGNFYFEGDITEPTWAFIRGNSKMMDDAENPNITDFFLEPTIMTVTAQYDHFKEMKITGSKTQLEYEALKRNYEKIDKSSDSLEERFSRVSKNFMINHPNSYVSAFELDSYKTRWTIDSVKSCYEKLSLSIQNSSYGKEVKMIIDEVENSSVGKIARSFSTTDINNNALSLSDFKGKYVLLDFWGSWCVPCRQSMPHLVDLFNKYHKDGFDVIAVAQEYDKTEDPWRDAIKKDGTGIWHNILSEIKSKNDHTIDESQSITKLFGVHVFPTKILIGKTGIIIGRYTGTEEESNLDKKLSEIFRQ